jgi:putative membrane protein
MKTISRIIWVVLFIVFFGFALKNTQEAALRFFFEYEIRGPLVLLLLAFFAAGAALGVLAVMPAMFRHRRDLSKCKKTIDAMQKENEAQRLARMQPPQPDSVVNK